MDTDKLKKLAFDFIVLYDQYQDSAKNLSYQAVNPVASALDGCFWDKEAGTFYYSEYHGEYGWDNEPWRWRTEDHEDGHELAFAIWPDPDDPIKGRLLIKDDTTRVHWGDWCPTKLYQGDSRLAQQFKDDMSALEKSDLEVYLKDIGAYGRISMALGAGKIKAKPAVVSYPASLVRSGYEQVFLNEERQLELAVMRVVAGGLIVFLNPLQFSDRGVEAGAAKLVVPTKRARKLASSLLEELHPQFLQEGGAATEWVKKIARGENKKINNPVETTLELQRRGLVREASLISNQLLIINNGKANRLPARVIKIILGMLGDDAADVSDKTIGNYQSKYDGSEEDYLTKNGHLYRFYDDLDRPFFSDLPF